MTVDRSKAARRLRRAAAPATLERIARAPGVDMYARLDVASLHYRITLKVPAGVVDVYLATESWYVPGGGEAGAGIDAMLAWIAAR
jgi:hypothetical protein